MVRKVAICLSLAILAPVSAVAAGNPFLGVWHVASAAPAPWHDAGAGPASIDDVLLHSLVKFGGDGVYGAPSVACRSVRYKIATVGPDALFAGRLRDPQTDVRALGFAGDQIVTADEICAAKESDVGLAMVDHKTMLLDLGDVIYTLKRR